MTFKIPVKERKAKPEKKASAGENKKDGSQFEPDHDGFIGGYFRPLGHSKSEDGQVVFYFFSKLCNYILRFPPSKLQKQYLLQLAPLEFWVEKFPNKSEGSFNAMTAADFLARGCLSQGHFKEQSIRGRGVWKDNDLYVIHLGDRLLVDNKEMPLFSTTLEGCYELREAIKIKDKPLSKTESSTLNRILSPLAWESSLDGLLLSGWLFIAPISGVLPWRPHVWITGKTGSGKTWVFDEVCSKILDGVSFRFQGDSSAAGIRQSFNGDALPTLFDEAEGENLRAQERMEFVLQLARAASSGNGAPNVKGQKDGGSVAYSVKSCFLMSSIVPQIKHGADLRRFTVLNLARMADDKKFGQIEKLRAQTLTPEFCKRWQMRSFALVENTIKSIEVFVMVIAKATNNRALANQMGVILGGWWHTWNDDVVTLEQACTEAETFLENKSFDDEFGTSDEIRTLQILLGRELKVEGEHTHKTLTVGELVNIVTGDLVGFGISSDEAKSRLKRCGLTVREDGGNYYFAVLSNSKFVADAMRGTFAGENYSHLLRRLDGSFVKQVNFGSGLNGKSVHVPIKFIQ